MEVRPGYKQTEAGVIPEDWEIRSVDQIGEIKTGPFGTLLKASEYSGNDGVPLISVGEVGDGRFRVTEHTPRVPERVVRRLPQYVLRTGDIVFGRKGAVERSALVSQHENGWFLGSDGISVRPLSSCVPPYLAAQFRSYSVRSWLVQNAIGTTMASLNQGILSRVLVPYAPIPEQRAIAAALSDVDALLGGLDRLIAKKRDLKQAAMQRLLTGQTRLPGFHGEWEVKALAAVCSMKSGEGITGANIDQHSQYPCYGGNGLRGFTSRFTHSGRYALIGRQGALCGNVFGVEGQFFASEHAVVVTAYERTNIRWLTCVLGRMNLNQYSESSAQPGLSVSKILNLTISAPPTEDEQAAIASVHSDMDAELAALEARRDKTRALKQAMMQELLTGKTRLVPHDATRTEVKA
jgi:type I restriction enzyme, S subunit